MNDDSRDGSASGLRMCVCCFNSCREFDVRCSQVFDLSRKETWYIGGWVCLILSHPPSTAQIMTVNKIFEYWARMLPLQNKPMLSCPSSRQPYKVSETLIPGTHEILSIFHTTPKIYVGPPFPPPFWGKFHLYHLM